MNHTPVTPTVVVELAVDGALEFGRWRHGARYLRVRTELRPTDLAPWPDRSADVPVSG